MIYIAFGYIFGVAIPNLIKFWNLEEKVKKLEIEIEQLKQKHHD